MKIIEEYTYTLPDWCLSALINADRSGLSDEDEADLNRFVARTQDDMIEQWGGDISLVWDDIKDIGFHYWNDINWYGSTCHKVKLYVYDASIPVK